MAERVVAEKLTRDEAAAAVREKTGRGEAAHARAGWRSAWTPAVR